MFREEVELITKLYEIMAHRISIYKVNYKIKKLAFYI